jgi:DNA-binding transcriptional regulator YhcF (GntR family)
MRTYPLWQHLAIDNRSGDIVGQLYSQLRAAVLAGALPRDTRLPSSRETAAMLGIARGTVTEAYARLVSDDVLTTRRGSGTFVGAAGGLTDGVRERSKHEPYASRGHRPLTPGLPALSLFPIPQWTRLYARSLRQNARDLLHYGDPQGYKPLREAIAGYLRVMRGIVADPSNILITGGSVAAVALAASVLRKQGATAWVENPGHPPARTALECAGIRVVACPVDCGGMIIAAAARIAPRPTLALVTPAHQYPLGAALLPERKSALLGLAESRNFLIIEDDYDHEFSLRRRAEPASQGDGAGPGGLSRDVQQVAGAGPEARFRRCAIRFGPKHGGAAEGVRSTSADVRSGDDRCFHPGCPTRRARAANAGHLFRTAHRDARCTGRRHRALGKCSGSRVWIAIGVAATGGVRRENRRKPCGQGRTRRDGARPFLAEASVVDRNVGPACGFRGQRSDRAPTIGRSVATNRLRGPKGLGPVGGNRAKLVAAHLVMAGLVPAIPIIGHCAILIEIAGTSPAMTP